MKKKRIAIVTLYYRNNNYGGVAQAYALCTYLNLRGYDAELLSYAKACGLSGTFQDRMAAHTDAGGIKGTCRGAAWILSYLLDMCVTSKIKKKRFSRFAEPLKLRNKEFQKFRDEIPHSKVYTAESLSESVPTYDCFVCGSDQIWKPGVIQDAYVLKFVPAEKKKISYAASVTVSGIGKRQWLCDYFKENLASFDRLSVREEATKNELQEILGRKVDWVVDPTLLLDCQYWDRLASDRLVREKYLFAYFLGGSRTQRDFVAAFAKKNGFKVVTLPFASGKYAKADETFGNDRLFDVGVRDFFSLIKYSEMVFTDSFHAVCFARAFHKEFYVMKREVKSAGDEMSQRIISLLQMMGLQDRIIDVRTDPKITKPIDFSLVEKRLSNYIEFSKKYLDDALGNP